LILEDWHWADEASESALKHLAGFVAGQPIQVVITCRPEYERKWPDPRNHTPLRLQPLARNDTTAMLCAVWGVEQLPEGLAEHVHTCTGGNALFNEEIARALVEDDKIDVNAVRATVKGSLSDLQLPDTVHAVIRARVDRLAPEASEVLRLASVIGREFVLPLVEKLHSAPGQIPGALEILARQDLIHPVQVVPEPTYLFKHALVQDVVYDMLLLSKRKTLHKHVAVTIESLYADRIQEQYENLANHYEKAEVYDKAIEYLESAANKAISYSSLQEARGYCQRAVALLDSIEETTSEREARIRITLLWAEIGTGLPSPELAAACERAFQCAKELGARSDALSIASWDAHIRTVLGEAERGLELARCVIAEGDSSLDNSAVGRAHAVLGNSATWNGRPDLGLQHARLARSSLQHGMGPFWDGFLLAISGLSAALVGDFNASSRWLKQSAELTSFEDSIEPWIHVFSGYSCSEQAKWAEASESSQKGRDIAKQRDDLWPAAWGRVTDGYAKVMAGRGEDGYFILRQAVAELEELKTGGTHFTISWAYALLAEASLILGEVANGSKFAQASKDSLEDGDRIAEPITYRAIATGVALSEPMKWDKVLSNLQTSIDIACTAGRLPQAARSYFRYAECLHKKGDLSGALEQLSRTDRLFAEMDMLWWSDQGAKLRARIESNRPFIWFAPYADGPPKPAI
jgi:tetratricopeptide (TPR) repeat protein